MVQFILTDILMVALGAMIFIVARSLPRLPEAEPVEQRSTLVERWVMSDIPHRIDEATSFWLGKLFRRLKIVLMRCDNYLTIQLKHFGGNGNGQKKIDFKDLQEGSTDVGPGDQGSAQV